MSAKTILTTDNWLDKIAKLIPGEAVTLFIATANIVAVSGLDDSDKMNLTLGVAIAVAFVIPLLLYKVDKVRRISPYAISIVAFALWVFNTNFDALPSITAYPTMERVIGSIALIIYTVIAPLFVTAEQ